MVTLYTLNLHHLSLAHKAAIPCFSMFSIAINKIILRRLFPAIVFDNLFNIYVSHKQQFFDRTCLHWQPYCIKIKASMRFSVHSNTVYASAQWEKNSFHVGSLKDVLWLFITHKKTSALLGQQTYFKYCTDKSSEL